MDENDFLEIIKPLALLETDKYNFLKTALVSGFRMWKEDNGKGYINPLTEDCPFRKNGFCTA